MNTYTPANSIFGGPITNLLSILCILIQVLSLAHEKGRKSLNDFKFGTFAARFPSDTMANMVMKGLIRLLLRNKVDTDTEGS